ncbi:helix-turn-helix domain-containing protein [Corynebacterium striatum]|uniref:helix-turn-helix domain-containing protein n=1 Tax=Corynebacterium striatum TaxID=43770 RepID=UPI003B5CE707
MTPINLLGTKEVAEIMGTNRTTINRWVDSGRIKPVGSVGKRGIRVFDRAEIEALAEAEGAKQ